VFGGVACNLLDLTDDMLECELERPPVCGELKPELITKLGAVPMNSDVVGQRVECAVTDASPRKQLSLQGGDTITIKGTNFPEGNDLGKIEVTFKNDKVTKCVPKTSREN